MSNECIAQRFVRQNSFGRDWSYQRPKSTSDAQGPPQFLPKFPQNWHNPDFFRAGGQNWNFLGDQATGNPDYPAEPNPIITWSPILHPHLPTILFAPHNPHQHFNGRAPKPLIHPKPGLSGSKIPPTKSQPPYQHSRPSKNYELERSYEDWNLIHGQELHKTENNNWDKSNSSSQQKFGQKKWQSFFQ